VFKKLILVLLLISAPIAKATSEVKIAIVGEYQCGKSTFRSLAFDINHDGQQTTINSAVPIDYGSRRDKYRLQVWDTIGHEDNRDLVISRLDNAHVVFLVVDLTRNLDDPNVLQKECLNWIELIKSRAPDCKIIIVGSKGDSIPELVKTRRFNGIDGRSGILAESLRRYDRDNPSAFTCDLIESVYTDPDKTYANMGMVLEPHLKFLKNAGRLQTLDQTPVVALEEYNIMCARYNQRLANERLERAKNDYEVAKSNLEIERSKKYCYYEPCNNRFVPNRSEDSYDATKYCSIGCQKKTQGSCSIC